MNTTDVEPRSQRASRGRRWLMQLPAWVILAFFAFRFIQLHQINAPKQIDRSTLALVNLDGTSMGEAATAGKAIVLNYWAPWCPPCKLEIPWLQHIQDLHPDDLAVVGVVADPDQYKHAQAFMISRGISSTLARETPALDHVVGVVSALPTTFYISASGRVAHATSGLIPEPLMKRYAADALGK